MADIQLRFNKDLLVLSSPVRTELERLGVDAERDGEMTLLIEPEVYDELYALDAAAGAQCLVTDTAALTPARLAHSRMSDAGKQLAATAIKVVRSQNPQHVLVELGPCGLPIDASSKASLNEIRDQYVRAAGFFADEEDSFDAFFLNGFDSCTELKCALMGLRKVTDKPIFASVDLVDHWGEMMAAAVEGALDAASTDALGALAGVDGGVGFDTGLEAEALLDDLDELASPEIGIEHLLGRRTETLKDAVAVMAEYGAQVVGFRTAAPPEAIADLVKEVRSAVSMLPIMVQMSVRRVDPEQEDPTPENPYFEPDSMVDAATTLASAGVQFMRAVGDSTPAYTGALVAATIGDTVERPEILEQETVVRSADPKALAEMLRQRVNDAIGSN